MATPQQGRGAPPGSAVASGARPDVVGLNPCLTCKLCNGYLVDAMTLVKCLHSFCRSCILKHLETGHACPVCDLRLSKINMESHLIKDDTLQNVVYKAVPGLYQKEMKRRRDFYATKGSKADQASLSPEQKGELDSSSSGRIIFSPDEAVSLSLEYKPIIDVKTEPEASSSAGPSSQAFKEPTKRYLNCPAAVTIALLQKFLRMKYSISAKYKVDILYMDDVLWSHYMLMDVAYIYSWKRDMPLRLFYRVFESTPKLSAPLASTVQVPTSAQSLAQSAAQQSGSVSSCVTPGISARGPTLSKSASMTEESRGCKKETTSPDTEAKPIERAPSVTESPPPKPTNETSGTSIADPKVQSKIDASCPEKTNPTSVAGRSKESKATKTTVAVPSTATAQVGCVQQKVPYVPATPPSKICALAKIAAEPSTSKGPSTAEAVNPSAASAALASPTKPDTAAVHKVSSVSDKDAKVVAVDEPVSHLPAKVPPSLTNSAVVENAESQKATPQPSTVAPSARQEAGSKPARACERTLTFKANPATDSGSSARTAGFVMKYQPRVVTPTLNGIDKGLADGLVKSAICTSNVTCDQITKDAIVDVGTLSTSSTLAKSAPSLLEDKDVEQKAPETEEVQTCISRAAHKAEEKLNAIKAAAALVKETSPSEKDSTESTTGGLSVTLRPNRISVRSHSDDLTDKRPRKPSQGELSSKSEPAASKPPCRSVTPPLPVIPSYLTLSKSHPSLFHTSPRKRGRPKLATVNSLNEEIERAHMMARSEMGLATAADKPITRDETAIAAAAEKPKPVIPVITSLKIKPIPPPPPPQQPEVATLSSPTAPDAPRDLQLRPRSKSQGDISEEKSSDAEDSIGRRKSKRKRQPTEQLKTMVTQLKELSLEKVQAATQEPLQSLSGRSTLGLPKPEQGPEKITLRVTRDEKCILKVEKQLRPAVISETLHDSGFCEDVVADSVASSPVPDPKLKGESLAAARTVQHNSARQNVVSSTTTNKGLEQIGAARHLQHGTKRDMRRSRRKSVEDWVNEQSKWVRTHEAEAVRHQDIVLPNSKPDRSGRGAVSGPPALSELKQTPAKVQRRGRKRTNPVKITKPAPMVDTQQEKPVSGPARVSSSSTEAATPPHASPSTEKESGAEAGSKGSTPSPRSSSSRNRQEPSEYPKKSQELVIPRYIPNAATSVPLTVTHARNKRLRESRQEASAASCLDLSSSQSSRGTSAESPEKNSEKSKFFKEALNLSMKEAEIPAAFCKDTCVENASHVKRPEDTAGAPVQGMHSVLPAEGAAAESSKTVTKSLDQALPNHANASQLSIIHQVVEKIASRNSCKLPKSHQEAVNTAPASTKGDNEMNCRDGRKCSPREDMSRSPPSSSSGQPVSSGEGHKDDTDGTFTRNDMLASSSVKTVGAKAGLSTVADAKVPLSEQSPKMAQTQDFNSTLQGNTVESEILPRINETGVFRLEFPAAELSVPSEPRSSKEEAAITPSSNSAEQPQSCGSSSLAGEKMSESLRNIVLVQESMMELRQGVSRAGSCGLVEGRAKDVSAAEKIAQTNTLPSKAKSPVLESSLNTTIKKEHSSSSNTTRTPSSTHSRSQPILQFPVRDVKAAREIGVMVPGATPLNEAFSGSSVPCTRPKSAEHLVKSSPEHRLSPILGATPLLVMPGRTNMVEREHYPSKLQGGPVRSIRSPVRSPLGIEVKSPSPAGHGSSGSCASRNATSPIKSPVPSEAKSTNPLGYNPAGVCGVPTMQHVPRPARSPVSDPRDSSTASHCISGSPMRTTDVKVGKLQQERSLWRPIDICTSQQLREAALQKIAANKSISIGQVRDTRPQVPCRNRQGVALDVPHVPRSLSVSIVTCNAGLKGSYTQQANQITRASQPVECLSMSQQLSLGNRKHTDFLVKEALPSPQCLDTAVDCGTLLSRTHPELSITSRSEFKSGIHIPASLKVYPSMQQKSSLSPPLCKSTFLPEERTLPRPPSAGLEQPRISPRPSDRVPGRALAKDICQPEGQGISSSNEVLASKTSARKESGMPSPRASENMYRTTVAELDLFTTLSIIETMKGRATVHDIIDEYITNIGSFFCIMESLPAEGRRAAEVTCSLKEKALLKVTALLKKVTNKLSSGQLSRALAVEALVQRFLLRCCHSHSQTLSAASTSEDDVTSSVWGTSCVVPALGEHNVTNVKGEPPPLVVPGFEFAVVPVLDVHFRHTELKRKALKRLRHSLRLGDLVGLKRKLMSSANLPGKAGICRRLAPRRSGGCFSSRSALRQVQKCSFLPQPTPSVHLPGKSLARFLPAASFGLPQSTVIVDALSSLLTGHTPNLVNRSVPRNGQCCSLVLAPSARAIADSPSSALQAYRDPGTAQNMENILSALSLFLSGQSDSVSSHAPQQVLHFGSGGSIVVPSTHLHSSNRQHRSCNMLLVEATAESSLVISSPQSNSKLVIGPDFDRQLLSRLLDGITFTIPKTQETANSWLNSVMHRAVAAGHSSGRMLTNCVDTPDQRWPTTEALGSSSCRAIASVKRGLVARPDLLTRPKLLAKPELLAKPKAAVSRKLLQKRGALTTGICEVAPVQKRKRLSNTSVHSDVTEAHPVALQQRRFVAARLAREARKVVPKDCIVVLHRLELQDGEETKKKRCSSDGSGAQPKKKPKLSPFPKAPSCVRR